VIVRLIGFGVLLLTLMVVAGFVWPGPIVGWLEERSPSVRFDADVETKLLALTIDDGPSESTAEMLEVLDRFDARATFFLIGSRVPGREDTVRTVVDRGHEIGHHMWCDETSVFLDEDDFRHRFERTERALEPFAKELAWFRPAGGWYDEAMVARVEREGYRVALGSAPPLDTFLPSPRVVARYLQANARPGAILVLHDGPERGARTVEVLERLLPELEREGYRVVDLSGLVAVERRVVGRVAPD